MSKRVSWILYSKRRHVTVQQLADSGKISDYASYLNYCDRLKVQPLTAQEFSAEVTFKESPVQVEAVINAEEQSVADAAVESSLEDSGTDVVQSTSDDVRLESSVADAPVISNISDEPQTLPLVATVWLAGVSDETKPAVNMSSLLPQKQEDVRYKTKKKKNKG